MIVGTRDNRPHGPIIIGVNEVETNCEHERVRTSDTEIVTIALFTQPLTIVVGGKLVD